MSTLHSRGGADCRTDSCGAEQEDWVEGGHTGSSVQGIEVGACILSFSNCLSDRTKDVFLQSLCVLLFKLKLRLPLPLAVLESFILNSLVELLWNYVHRE